MDLFDLAAYEIPATLYRVQYAESVTKYDFDGGLEAQDDETIFDEETGLDDFIDAVERHLSWEYENTIFISLFADKTHAENWMLERHLRFRSTDCTLLEIDMTELLGFYVFRAQEIVDMFSLSVPNGAYSTVADEYLVVHYIPPSSILSSQTVYDIEFGKTPLGMV
ncbi:unnamed protein product [Penicillium salamii]|uniref:DUF7587 domain-containing protein n=1 Tax=Penicillium salamii TaxID=1612424 RepID=A0A9W4IG67_9EURO|nr:unnamed protein product [Penicillium salamii]